LFEDGRFFHADGKAKFLFEEPRAMPEAPDEAFPFLLLTGRGGASQWHTGTRTSKSAVLRKLYPKDVYVEINAADAHTLGIRANHKVHIESRRGKIVASAVLTHGVSPGNVFMSMHYPETNYLTHPSFDPYSFQPSYKACAVRVSSAGGRVSRGESD
jgi:assimilatory nitrate reductase catalytic subunit